MDKRNTKRKAKKELKEFLEKNKKERRIFYLTNLIIQDIIDKTTLGTHLY